MDNGGMPTLGVLIPTANRRDRIVACIEAVLAQDPHEVVVIVNGDDDGSLATVRKMADGDGRVITMKGEVKGQFPSLQVGLERATADIVLCLDDDVVAAPGLLAAHCRLHVDASRRVVLGYMPTQLPSVRQRGQVATFLYAGDYEAQCRIYDRNPAAVLADFWAGNFSISRQVAFEVGFYCAGAPITYHDDRNFGLRCRAAAVEPVFDRRLLATHEHSRSVAQFLTDARRRGIGELSVHTAHRSVVGPIDVGRYGANLPALARWVVQRGQSPRAAAPALAGVRAVLVAAGAIRWWRMESLAANMAMNLIEIRTITDIQAETSAAHREDSSAPARND